LMSDLIFLRSRLTAPCSDEYNPVNIAACEGKVHGATVIAFSKIVESVEKESMFGVVFSRLLVGGILSALTQSRTMSNMLGLSNYTRLQANENKCGDRSQHFQHFSL